jgi:hypothetical protein
MAVAERTIQEAGDAQGRARDLLAPVLPLLHGWREPAGDRVRGALTRPEWLLDGWSQICGLWESVARDERSLQRETVQQIRASLPMLDPSDREAAAAPDARDLRFDRWRRVKLHEDWRTGLAVMDDRARAELLRAATA